MVVTRTANELNTLAGEVSGAAGPEERLVAEPPAANVQAELEEEDDGVEALIIRMDRTTAEHLFLHAQRHL